MRFKIFYIYFFLSICCYVNALAQIKTSVFWECRLEYQCPWGWKSFNHSVVFTPSFAGRGVTASGVEGGDLIIFPLFDNEYSFEISDNRCNRKGKLKYSTLGKVEYLSGTWETNGDNTAMWGTGLCCRGNIELRREVLEPLLQNEETTFYSGSSDYNNFSNYSRLDVGKKYLLSNVFFALNSSELQAQSFAELSALANVLKSNKEMIVCLEGHTDIIGNHKSNMQLSKQRVKSVKKELKRQGVAGNRIKLKWYGDTQPIINFGTVEERKENRRVELRVLKN